MQKIGATGDGKSAVATPDGKKPKEEEDKVNMDWTEIGIKELEGHRMWEKYQRKCRKVD